MKSDRRRRVLCAGLTCELAFCLPQMFQLPVIKLDYVFDPCNSCWLHLIGKHIENHGVQADVHTHTLYSSNFLGPADVVCS